jgi:hypothetical protein
MCFSQQGKEGGKEEKSGRRKKTGAKFLRMENQWIQWIEWISGSNINR